MAQLHHCSPRTAAGHVAVCLERGRREAPVGFVAENPVAPIVSGAHHLGNVARLGGEERARTCRGRSMNRSAMGQHTGKSSGGPK